MSLPPPNLITPHEMTTCADAFLLLQVFRRRALPTLLRKLHIWKGLSATSHPDLIEDLEQELWLDCVQHHEIIVELPSRERHTRWFRLIEKNHYRLHLRSERVRAADSPLEALVDDHQYPHSWEEETDPIADCGDVLAISESEFLRRLQRSARYLKNGRINCRESAVAMGMRPADLRETWGQVASGLGLGHEYLEFWRRRLVEALVGLAADLLRDAGQVSVHDEGKRRLPDPRGRMRRIRRLRQHIDQRPLPHDIKSVLTHYHMRKTMDHLRPRAILDDAERLLPNEPSIHLWSFEAAMVEGDFAAAARSIRSARRDGAAKVPVLLARARLLEARRREPRAHRLIAKSIAGRRGDERLASALQALAG